MNFKEIRYLFTVLEAGTISDAAKTLGLTQSSLSRHIRRLEAEYGIEFLDRSSRRISATKAGEKYFELARQMLPLLDALEFPERSDPADSGDLSLGITPISDILPRLNAIGEISNIQKVEYGLPIKTAFEQLNDSTLDLVLTDTAPAKQKRNFSHYELAKQDLIELIIPQRQFSVFTNRSFSIQQVLRAIQEQPEASFVLIGSDSQIQPMKEFLANYFPNSARPVISSDLPDAAACLSKAGYYGIAPHRFVRELEKNITLSSLPLEQEYVCSELLLFFRRHDAVSPQLSIALSQLADLFSQKPVTYY